MANILTSADLHLPPHMAGEIIQKVQTGSVIGSLRAGEVAMPYGDTDYLTFTETPRAQIVAEGAKKSGSKVATKVVKAKPIKMQVTTRFNDEVMRADEQRQAKVLDAVALQIAKALDRAVDLVIFHGINPLTGQAADSINGHLSETTLSVEYGGKAAKALDAQIEMAEGLILDKGYAADGLAITPRVGFDLGHLRSTQGVKLYPEIGMRGGQFDGLPAYASTTVSGSPEIAAATNIGAFVGDWQQLRWGIMENIPLEVIEYGDPDNTGVDLKGSNQVAFRGEVFFGYGILDKDAFSIVKAATA